MHRGTIGQGHYIAYVKNNSDWFEINDNRVQLVDQLAVEAQHAYMLFYELEHEPLPILMNPKKKQKLK